MTTESQDGKSLRKFGLTVGAGLGLLGAISWYRGHEIAPLALWAPAAALGLTALVFPKGLAPVERGWMRLGLTLAWVNTRIILVLVFALVVVPISAVMRLFRDPLSRKLDKKSASYWLTRNPAMVNPDAYKRQF